MVLPFGLSSMQDSGPHGFSEVLYLYTSQTANNGSAFAGFTGNTLWYNTTGGLAMLIGRYFVIVPMMAVAGSLVVKKSVPASAGTFPTHGALFVGLLVGVILIVGGLTFFPALALGPIVEHLAMQSRTHCSDRRFRSLSPWKPQNCASALPASTLLDPKIIVPGDRRSSFVKLDPRTLVRNPVIFVLEVVAALRPRFCWFATGSTAAPRISASPSRSCCGCGSRCCSPISPKPWPKAAARRRPTRCARTRTETRAKRS